MTSPYNEKVNKLNTALENVYLKKADLIDELEDTLDGIDSTYQKQNMGVSYANKNVVTDSNGVITTEEKPTIPSASSTVPSADTTSGGSGSSSDFARADHIHPKSSLYASSSHTHTSLIETEIPSNSDLDSYITEGVFYYKREQSDAITNIPSIDTPFTLFVFYTIFNGRKIIVQQLIDVNVDIFTRRRGNHAIWSDWVPLLSSNNISDNLTTNSATQALSAKQGKWLKDNTASASHDHDHISGGMSGVSIFDDTDGVGMYALGDKIIYDWSDSDLVYYDKNGNGIDGDNEIATKGDISDAVGSAITYINS